MHYYPDDQSKENLERIRRESLCSVCGRQVAIFLDLRDKRQYIACSGQVHEGITREYKPPVEDYESNIRREHKMVEENVMTHQETSALVSQGIPMTGLITKDQATAILKTVWKDAPEIEVYKAAMLCQDFGLHPLMKHVYLIPYNKKKDGRIIGTTWSTVLGIGATRLIMSRLGSFGYTDDTPRIMSEEEQLKIFGEVDNTNVVAITRLRTKDGLEANGYGKYPKNATLIGADKGNTHANMAFIRSERNAFGRLFPDANMPKADIEVVDEKYLETPSGLVEIATGEIKEETVEGEAQAVEEERTTLPEPEPGSDLSKSIIDIAWLRESVKELQDRGQKAYSDGSLLSYMKSVYKGVAGDTIYKIAANLDKGMAKHFENVIQDALSKKS